MRLEIKPKSIRKRKRIPKVIPLVLLSLILLAGLFLAWGKTSVRLQEVAQSELESIAYDIIGDVVTQELTSGEDYENIIITEKDAEGKISSIQTDTQKLNILKLRITNELSKIMLNRAYDTVQIPLGSLTGIDFLSGRGPLVKFKVYWVSGVDSGFSTEFEGAGINQTNYRVMMDFSVNVGTMLNGREVGVDVGRSICIAETVIVGEIPKILYNK